MKIYVAGAYTLYNDHGACVEKFNQTKRQLMDIGFVKENIIVPTDIVPEGTGWDDAMFEYCIPSLLQCKAILLQSDWANSRGARLELREALKCKMDIYFEEDGGLKILKNIMELICS